LIGLPIEVTLLDDPNQTVTGEVVEVSPITGSQTGTVEVRVELPGEDEVFGLGTAVTAEFEIASYDVISVPAAALATQNGVPAVWVIDPATQRVSLRQVSIRRYTSTSIEIASGLELGEWVAVEGAHMLYP